MSKKVNEALPLFLACDEPHGVHCGTKLQSTALTTAGGLADEQATAYAAQGGHCFVCGVHRQPEQLRLVMVSPLAGWKGPDGPVMTAGSANKKAARSNETRRQPRR